MNAQQMTDTYNKADKLAAQITTFWAKSVGFGVNQMEETSLLMHWDAAIKAAQDLAIQLRDWVGVDYFDAMADECQMWMSHN